MTFRDLLQWEVRGDRHRPTLEFFFREMEIYCTVIDRMVPEKMKRVLDDALKLLFVHTGDGKVCAWLDEEKMCHLPFSRVTWPDGPRPHPTDDEWCRRGCAHGLVRDGGSLHDNFSGRGTHSLGEYTVGDHGRP